MYTIADYVSWRGDLAFDRDPFNEVDNLLLSMFSYIEWGGIVSDKIGLESSISFQEAATRWLEKENKTEYIVSMPAYKEVPIILEKASKMPRFKDIRMHGFSVILDPEETRQFSAVIFTVRKDRHFVAFRGTDDSIAGWKEDFQLSFKAEIPAQQAGAVYLKEVCGALPGYFAVGGHSKGGNIAVFSALQLPDSLQNRVLDIYSNDGPGLREALVESEKYKRVQSRIHTIVPKSSIIGMVLEHGEDFRVINSQGVGILQHNGLLWAVEGCRFVDEAGLTEESLRMNRTVRKWMETLTYEEKEDFVEGLFGIFEAAGTQTFTDWKTERLSRLEAMLKAYKEMDDKTRSGLVLGMELLISESNRQLLHSIGKRFSSLFEKEKKENAEQK